MTSVIRANIWQNSAGVPYGTVLQVVQATNSAQPSLSGTFNTTVVSGTIVPRSISSRIYLSAWASGYISTTGDFSFGTQFRRDGTPVLTQSEVMYGNFGSGTAYFVPFGNHYIDSPATTNSITYAWNVTGTSRGSIQVNRNQSLIIMMLMEIAV
jgi:hypothetical protein